MVFYPGDIAIGFLKTLASQSPEEAATLETIERFLVIRRDVLQPNDFTQIQLMDVELDVVRDIPVEEMSAVEKLEHIADIADKLQQGFGNLDGDIKEARTRAENLEEANEAQQIVALYAGHEADLIELAPHLDILLRKVFGLATFYACEPTIDDPYIVIHNGRQMIEMNIGTGEQKKPLVDAVLYRVETMDDDIVQTVWDDIYAVGEYIVREAGRNPQEQNKGLRLMKRGLELFGTEQPEETLEFLFRRVIAIDNSPPNHHIIDTFARNHIRAVIAGGVQDEQADYFESPADELRTHCRTYNLRGQQAVAIE